MTKIKILVTYKDKHSIIKSDIIEPIQTGRAIADEIFTGMIGDNTGDNISDRNLRYNELTAQYWAWKNFHKLDNPDYVGFMHYRRHFLFNDTLPLPKCTWHKYGHIHIFHKICPQYLKYISDEDIEKYFPKYDCMVIKPYDTAIFNPQYTCIRDNFIRTKEQEGYFYDILLDTVKKLHPDYTKEINEFANGTEQYLCNMFVMRKDLFEDYCDFLFSTLDAVDKKIDSTEFSTAKSRFLGFFGEYLLSIYLFKLRKNSCIKIKEMNASLILPPTQKDIKKYKKYKILRHIAFGKLKAKYESKYQYYKDYLNLDKFFES